MINLPEIDGPSVSKLDTKPITSRAEYIENILDIHEFTLSILKERIDDITGAELDAYKVVGDRLDLLEQKVELLLTHLGLKIEEDDN